MHLNIKFHEALVSDQKTIEIDFLFISGDCQRQGKVVCQQSMRCADQDLKDDDAGTQTPTRASADHLVCQDKKFLCINKSAACDGKFDCWANDTSDEQHCK